MAENTPAAPEPFRYTPTQGQSTGMSDSPTKGDYALRQRQVPPVVYAPVPGLTDGVPINTSEVVPHVAPETKPTVK